MAIVVSTREGALGRAQELWEAERSTAFGVALAIVRDRDAAEDVVSDAATRWLRAAGSGALDDCANLRAYLLCAVRSAAIDSLRRRARVRRPAPRQRAVTGGDPGERADQHAEHAAIVDALATLPARQQAVLWLVEVDGCSHGEAGAILAADNNSVRQLLHRARLGLRRRYLDALFGPAATECRAIRRELSAGRAPTGRAKEHLDGCDRCRECRDELTGLGFRLRGVVPPLVATTGAAPAAMARIGRDRPQTSPRSAQGAVPAAAATLLVLAAGLGAAVFVNGDRGDRVASSSPPSSVPEVVPGASQDPTLDHPDPVPPTGPRRGATGTTERDGGGQEPRADVPAGSRSATPDPADPTGEDSALVSAVVTVYGSELVDVALPVILSLPTIVVVEVTAAADGVDVIVEPFRGAR